MQFLTNFGKSGLQRRRRRRWMINMTNMTGVQISLKLSGNTCHDVYTTYTCEFVHLDTSQIYTLHIFQQVHLVHVWDLHVYVPTCSHQIHVFMYTRVHYSYVNTSYLPNLQSKRSHNWTNLLLSSSRIR